MEYISEKYPQFFEEYDKIYNKGDMTFWTELELKIADMKERFDVPLVCYFYHNKIKKRGKQQ